VRRPLALAAVLAAACDVPIGDPGVWLSSAAWAGAELGPPPLPAAPPERLRIVTFNVHFGADVDALAQAIRDNPRLAAAQVLFVQEIESHPGEGGSRASRLAGALGMGYAYLPSRDEGDGTHGLALLSTLPFAGVEVMVLPHVDLLVRPRPRIAVAAGVPLAGGGTLRLVNVHLDTRLNITDRLRQLRPAVVDAPTPVIAGGDLNTMPYLWAEGSVPLTSVESVAGTEQATLVDDFMDALGFAAPTADLGTTQFSSELIQELRLDSLYTRGLTATPGGVEREVDVSDHWPVWIEVAVP